MASNEDAYECYVCLEPITSEPHRVCHCTRLCLHPECQAKVVASSRSRRCAICKAEYNNVDVSWSCRPTRHGRYMGYLLTVSICLVVAAVYEAALVAFAKEPSWQSIGIAAAVFFMAASVVGCVGLSKLWSKEPRFEPYLRVRKPDAPKPMDIPAPAAKEETFSV